MLLGKLCILLLLLFTLLPGSEKLLYFNFFTLTLAPWLGSCQHWTISLIASYLPILKYQVLFIPGRSVLNATHLQSTCCFLYTCCHHFNGKKKKDELCPMVQLPCLTNLLLLRTTPSPVSRRWLIPGPASAFLYHSSYTGWVNSHVVLTISKI